MSDEASRQLRLHRDELAEPGTIRMVELAGHRVGLIRTADGVFALADRCPHRGAPLCSHGSAVTPIELSDTGPTLGPAYSQLRCPWHKWDYDIATGRCTVDPRLRVRTYAVWEDGDGIVVSIDRAAVGRGRRP